MPLFQNYQPYEIYEDEKIKQKGNILLPLDTSEKYPVLYLLHGQGASREWENHFVKEKLEKLIPMYNLKPMIIVLPSVEFNGAGSRIDSYLRFVVNKEINQLVNFINKEYYQFVLTGYENTAIAGNSAGASGALYAAVCNRKLFKHMGAFSPGAKVYRGDGERGWIKQKKNFKLNPDQSAIHFIGYSTAEGGEFVTGASLYLKELRCNGVNMKDCVLTSGTGHNFDTFMTLLERFLRYDIFK